MYKQSIRRLATEVNIPTTVSKTPSFNIASPPKYTLASLRSFPSLEPHTFIPLPNDFLNAPSRRDFLWSAVVFEADRARVGSGNAPTRSDKPFSNRKLRPQKGSGRARLGDANSPHMDNGLKAHGIKAPHDWSTELPSKLYSKAFQTAFSEQYKNGKLFIIGKDQTKETAINENDTDILEFEYDYPSATEQFVEAHELEKLNLLFITNDQRTNLLNSTEAIGKKASVIIKEEVEVRDILRANRIYIELPALQWFIGRHTVV
ncbi:ribosomal protein L4 domain-containing protein [Scheffersomyces amazonensis]|uniref:ribosomal protein L4 domain-containing protein n=1 Tax=Scheffersomyces amazonensis TaxID=1078765 RepID=UPI00315D304A